MTVADDHDGASDADLVRRARAGDKEAFAVLVVRHSGTARVLAARVLDDPELVADVVQEAVVTALLSLDRLQRPEAFRPWLCGIALNVARRWRRATRRATPLQGTQPVDPAPGPLEVAETADITRRVRQAIAELAAGQRQAVWLFYLQGLSHREVAAELGISVGAVKARLYQARAVLAPRLSPLAERSLPVSASRPTEPTWIDARIAGVRRPDDESYRNIDTVVLQEAAGDRELPIGVLSSSGIALAVILQSIEMPRPMTHQLTTDLVRAAGAEIVEVRITRLLEGSFYAEIVLDGAGGRREIDARPSDALSLAAILDVPVRVDARILDDPDAVGRTGWRDYPNTDADIAEKVRQNLLPPSEPQQ